jgi:PelA/Pel-15E family pectate lyase
MAAKLEKYRSGAERGLEFILASQNASGGWRGADVDAITFNDDLMTGVMNLLQDVVEGRECYAWVTGDQRLRVRYALERAVAVTLQCQIIVNGKRTAWCQQHDHRTLQPVKARSYELSSITAMETAGIIEFLMRIKSPSPDIDTAITSAVEWLEKSAIHGIRLERIDTDTLRALSAAYKRYDAVVVQDGNAPLIWARYYEVDSNRPFFCNRDGIKVFSLAEVDRERRIGYQWYGTWPEKVLRVEYPQWVKSH